MFWTEFRSALDLLLSSDKILCLTAKMIPRHDVPPNVGVPLGVENSSFGQGPERIMQKRGHSK